MQVICRCLRAHIFTHDGLEGLIEAHEANLILALWKCARKSKEEYNDYFLLVEGDLPKYIVYPSVMRAAKKALLKIHEILAIDGLEKTGLPIFQRIYNAYIQLDLTAHHLNNLKETVIGSDPVESCSNDQVNH